MAGGRGKIWAVIVVIIMMAMLCVAGCMRITADDLYSLPAVSEEYLRLQAQINAVLGQGAEFSPPTSGLYRQAVQLKDIDGSGVNEVIAFFSMPADSTLLIYIFRMVDGDYTVASIIEGVGSSIESVRYVDMDGDGVMEIIVGWQSGAALKYFSIYSLKDFHSILLAGAEYSELAICDLNGDSNDDVVAFRLPTQEIGAVAELFVLMPDGEIVVEEARLSSGIETIARVLTGQLLDGVPAVFVDSEGKFDDGSMVTDICAFREESFTNISLKSPSGISEDTVRTRTNCSDLDQDGIVKVPIARPLLSQSETTYFAIDWYAYSSLGAIRLATTTFHNNSDEWYLILPFDWRGKVTIRRESLLSGERTIVFSYIAGEDGPFEDFLKIHRLSGDYAGEQARAAGRTVLLSQGSSVYAFEMLAPADSYGLSFDEALIRANFRLIYTDWLAER